MASDPRKTAKEFADRGAEAELIREQTKRRKEIEQAAAQLEPYRTDYEELVSDEGRFFAFAHRMFAEDTFASLRFTGADIERAFAHVGSPKPDLLDDRTVELFRAAILHIADEERRRKLARALSGRLPELVAANCYLEALLVEEMTIQTVEDQDESNEFLFEMFKFGLRAWADEQTAKRESVLRAIGLDPARHPNLSPDELFASIQSAIADPTRASLFEAFLRENRQIQKELETHVTVSSRNAIHLLYREDSRFLLLQSEELQPWLTQFLQCISQPEFLSETTGGGWSKAEMQRLCDEMLLPLVREMADAIFTPDRLRRLVVDLRICQKNRLAAGDRESAHCLQGAITYVGDEQSPHFNIFLLNLCFISINSALDEMATKNSEDE